MESEPQMSHHPNISLCSALPNVSCIVSGAALPGSGVGGVAAESVPVRLCDLTSHLPGIKTITISAPGVLLEEWDPEKIEEGANVKPDAAEIVKELAEGMHVYILAHVSRHLTLMGFTMRPAHRLRVMWGRRRFGRLWKRLRFWDPVVGS